jgi:hypothetical protein
MSHEVFKYLETVAKRINELNYCQRILFCCSCAESCFTLIEAFGEKETINFFRGRIMEIWSDIQFSMSNLKPNTDNLLEDLSSLPEANEDDSNSPSYNVMRVLGLLYYLLNLINSNDSEDAISISEASHSIKGSIEFVLLNGVSFTGTIKQDDPPIQMTFGDKREISFQEEILDLIEEAKFPNEELCKTLKIKSTTYANEFSVEIEKFGEVRGFV